MTEKPNLPQDTQQKISILNMRVQTVNLALNDLLRDTDAAFKALFALNTGLEKENAELKGKLLKEINKDVPVPKKP
jgi:hypothetical protein